MLSFIRITVHVLSFIRITVHVLSFIRITVHLLKFRHSFIGLHPSNGTRFFRPSTLESKNNSSESRDSGDLF